MEIITSTTVFIILLHQILGGSIKSEVSGSLRNVSTQEPSEESTDQPQKLPITNPESLQDHLINFNETVPNKATLNLIEKVISSMRNKPLATKFPNKQFLGGRFPPFLERVIQRIQNYFSVYNPPEYFENSRPPVTSGDSISILCSNGENDSLSCKPASENENEEDCNQGIAENQLSENPDPQPTEDTGYNVVVTHTVVQDNMINVYSPSDPGSGGQFVSNVVVILEPSANEFSPPVETTTPRNKFYVYVNPTKANQNKNNFNTKSSMPVNEKPEMFQPYNNSTYTVLIRGNKLEEYSNNIENNDNSSLNPDISVYVQNSTGSKVVKNKCNPYQRGDCESKTEPASDSENAILNSRSTVDEKSAQDVPNINLVLSPPDERANKSCTKNKYDTSNTNIEYYVLKPDDGSLSKPKRNGTATNFYFLSKTKLENLSPPYLPPDETEDSDMGESATTSYVMPVHVDYTSTSRVPLLFNLFRRKQEEPR